MVPDVRRNKALPYGYAYVRIRVHEVLAPI